jgi:hypothetical protein
MKTFDTVPPSIQGMIKDVIRMTGIGVYTTVTSDPVEVPEFTDNGGVLHPAQTLPGLNTEVLETTLFETEYTDGLYTFSYNGVPLYIGVKMNEETNTIISATYEPK